MAESGTETQDTQAQHGKRPATRRMRRCSICGRTFPVPVLDPDAEEDEGGEGGEPATPEVFICDACADKIRADAVHERETPD